MDTTMELDDLKQAWQTLDRRLELQNALSLHMFKEDKLRKAKSRLRPLMLGAVLHILIGVVFTVFFATFWIAHLDNAVLMLSGIVMHAYSVLLIVFGMMELLTITRINYAEPVVTIQKYLAYLRTLRVRAMPWLGLPHWLLWVPLTLIVFKRFFGADLWANAPEVVGIFLAVGVLGLLATLWFLRWSTRPLPRRIGQYLWASSAGRSVSRAQAELDDIAKFSEE